jgi:hypothetical protein
MLISTPSSLVISPFFKTIIIANQPPSSTINRMILTRASRHILHTPPSSLVGQRRTLLGVVHAIDQRVYRWAQSVLPPISKTENIALGCGTIGT